MVKVEAYNINYDTDGKKVKLPKNIIFDVKKEDVKYLDDTIADMVSDETGYLVFNLQYRILKVKNG